MFFIHLLNRLDSITLWFSLIYILMNLCETDVGVTRTYSTFVDLPGKQSPPLRCLAFALVWRPTLFGKLPAFLFGGVFTRRSLGKLAFSYIHLFSAFHFSLAGFDWDIGFHL